MLAKRLHSGTFLDKEMTYDSLTARYALKSIVQYLCNGLSLSLPSFPTSLSKEI